MKTIVACVDFSESTSAVVETATTIATALGTKLYLLNVVVIQPGLGFEPPPLWGETLTQAIHCARIKLNELREPLLEYGVEVSTILLEEPASSVKAITEECQRIGAEMIVMGAHGHGAVHRVIMGSTAEGVLHKAKCPVVIVPRRPLNGTTAVKKSAAKKLSHTA